MADQHLSAKPKRQADEDRASFEPMGASARGQGQIRRNPSTDQKKVRRSQVRKTATVLSRSEFESLREVDATSLKPGDRWFNPGAGLAHYTKPDGSISSAMGFTENFDGYTFEVVSVNGNEVTARTEDGQVLTHAIPPGHKVLKMGSTKVAYDDGDGIRCDSCGRRAWSPITLRLRSGGEGHACTSNTDCVESLLDGGATLDPPTQTVRWSDGGESVIGVEDGSFFSRDAARKEAAQTNQVANFTRADGLGLEEGDPVHVLGNPTTATFVGYDSVTDRVTLRYEGGQTVEVSPDVVIPDDALSAQSRLTPSRTASIHDHILGHLRGRI